MQKIQILDEIEHIRKRKGMYIGSSEDVTHLVEEVLDNALDEVVNGYATEIHLIKEDDLYCVTDNGRGLPVYFDEKYQEDIPVLLCSKLFSGGKFNKENYEVSVGLNGVGLVVVNALSRFMKIEIFHDCNTIRNSKQIIKGIDKRKLDCKFIKFTYTFEDSILKDKQIEYYDQKPYSTKISFIPNRKYFDKITYDTKFILDRLRIASIFTGAKIYWKNGKIEKYIQEDLETYFSSYISIKRKNCIDPIRISFRNKKNSEGIDLILTWNLEETGYSFNASVNLLPVNQGTHINQLNLVIQNLFEEYRQKYKLTFNKLDSLVGIRYYFNIYLLNTEFSSQTKEKLTTNKREFEYIFNEVYKKLKLYFDKNKEVLELLLNRFQEYRDRISARKTTRQLVGNSNIRGITNKDSRLRDCTTTKIDKTELLICEGESAAGSLVQCRDYRYHAILPLKGKTINVVSNDLEKVLNNKEIIDIIKSIGVGMKLKDNDKLDLSKIRYSKIILVADADPDGGHILCLLMMALLKFVPDIVKEGYVYICIPPLYALKNKKEYIPFYSKEDLDDYIKKNNIDMRKYTLVRYKGLGEMNPNEMKKAAIDPNTRKLVQLKFVDDEEKLQELLELFTSSSARRKLLEES